MASTLRLDLLSSLSLNSLKVELSKIEISVYACLKCSRSDFFQIRAFLQRIIE